jgi:pimeloyl-ACP methyl ester carboxylesterase
MAYCFLLTFCACATKLSTANPHFKHSFQYTFCGHEGPAVLLVHGFGAFLEHFRDNICRVADAGHRVWAITMVGFGKSEKPNANYSELFWSELLRDFITDVVREPIHLVGNSIGGN